MKLRAILLLGVMVATSARATILPGGLVDGHFIGLGTASEYSVTIRVHRDPGLVPYFWANQFRVDTTAIDHGGYFGLQALGYTGDGRSGRLLIFSIWNATTAQPGPGVVATPFGGEGIGWSLRRLYDWKAHTPYTFRLRKEDGVWWRVTVTAPGIAPIELGRLQVTVDAMLRPDFAMFTEYYANLPACQDLPYARVYFERPRYGPQEALVINSPRPYGNCAQNARGAIVDGAILHRTGIARSTEAGSHHDFNGDGVSDIAWRNLDTGANLVWRSADAGRPQAITGVTSQAWKIVGTGDFNGDGIADLLWRNDHSGANTVWRSADSRQPQAVAGLTDLAWKVAGVEDFDGDGRSDILWRNARSGANAIWKSANRSTPLSVRALPNLAWQVAGVADFSGDGKADILWRNAATGANTIWRSGVAGDVQATAAVANTAWTVAGVADFDGDDKADILWRHAGTGANRYWKSANAATQQAMATLVNPAWQVAGTGDYNGDGKADVFWRHSTSGANVIWLAARATLPLAVASLPAPAWTAAR